MHPLDAINDLFSFGKSGLENEKKNNLIFKSKMYTFFGIELFGKYFRIEQRYPAIELEIGFLLMEC